jgi:hypothetical protein
MFAPKIAKVQTKAAENPTSKLAPQRSTLVTRPFGSGVVDQQHMHEQEDDPASLTARATKPALSWDFSKIPLFPPDLANRPQTPPPVAKLPLPGIIQPKFAIGGVDDPLEHEADRVADEVVRTPEAATGAQRTGIRSGLRAGPTGMAQEQRSGPSPESFRGRGEPLPSPVRGFFERRLDYDFGSVRVHHNADAADSALSLGARAYTYGRDIVFGAGAYSPRSSQGSKLLAHELTHVMQQAAGQPLVQRSALSDSLKAAWKANPEIEALLARLGAPDMQTDAAHADKDIDTELGNMLKDDDLWLARRIWQGKLGDTTGARSPKKKAQPVTVNFFQGSTDRRALVIAGVHGSEKQGIEVANMLIHDLQPPAPLPVLTTIIVPSLFPDNALLTGSAAREDKDTPTNRNFPFPSEDLAAATAIGGGKALDARRRAILPENLMLIELMERFHPERIISIHGTQAPGQAGVFYDRRSPSEAEDRSARELAKGIEGGQELPAAVQQRLHWARLAAISAQAEDRDRDLSLKAASQIDTATESITGREARGMGREHETAKKTKEETPKRLKHPSIGGNVGATGAIENATWLGSVPGGVSLGGYAPPRGMSVFTVEPPVDAPSKVYPNAKGDPNAKDEVSGDVEKLNRADRITELQSYANAVRTILLGT